MDMELSAKVVVLDVFRPPMMAKIIGRSPWKDEDLVLKKVEKPFELR
jgi:hypothetical protein